MGKEPTTSEETTLGEHQSVGRGNTVGAVLGRGERRGGEVEGSSVRKVHTMQAGGPAQIAASMQRLLGQRQEHPQSSLPS